MQQLHSLEDALVKVFKDLPHLPKGLRDWLYENVWWIVIVGLVLGVMGVLGTFGSLALLASLATGMYGFAFAGLALAVSVINIIVLIATLIIEAMAIQPLKNKQKRGWDLLFLSLVVSVAGSVVASLIGMNIFGIVGIALGAAIGGYLLFEMRGHYIGAPVIAKAARVVPPKAE